MSFKKNEEHQNIIKEKRKKMVGLEGKKTVGFGDGVGFI